MKIIMATWFEKNQKESLDLCGKEERLLSFYFCREQKSNCIEEYCENLSCGPERNHPE